jgi:dTMP kinase
MSSPSRGLFLVFEGLDRSGKSTQSKRIADWLRSEKGSTVVQINFPNRGTTIGGLINSYLQSKSDLSDEAIHLLFSSNRWEYVKTLQAELEKGGGWI